VFCQEVIRRLETDNEALVKNLHTLLVVAEGRKDGHWQILKRRAFQHVKDNPALAEQVFAYMQDMQRRQSQPSGKEATDISTYILEASLLDDNKQHAPAALVVLSNNGVDYSASIIDKADTPEHARQSAILTFFRQYGNLHPHDTHYTPKLIDLALKRAKMKKGERFETLQELCKGLFTIDVMYNMTGREHDHKSTTIILTVTNIDTGEQLVHTRVGPKEVVRDKAAKDMLEDRRFHSMLTRCHHGLEISDELAPTAQEGLPSMIWAQSPHVDRPPGTEPQR
jgi:hypothetical protein